MNFDFLLEKTEFSEFSQACVDAEHSMQISTLNCAIMTRHALEMVVKWLYKNDKDFKLPYKDNLSALISTKEFVDILGQKCYVQARYIVDIGNYAVHNNAKVTRAEAIKALKNLFEIVDNVDYSYADEYQENPRVFDESIVAKEGSIKSTKQELENLVQQLESSQKALAEEIEKNKLSREANNKLRNYKVQIIPEYVQNEKEAQTRKLYIDLDLKLAGWDFDDSIEVEYEVKNMPITKENHTGIGYADYVLRGKNGKIVAVVEAKRSCVNPKVGKQQAKLYADQIELMQGLRPIIYYTNGYEIYLWDDMRYPERKVHGFMNVDEIELCIQRRNTLKDINSVEIDKTIAGRPYQEEAIISTCKSFQEGRRKALLVMATGSGKTRTAAALVDVLEKNNWVKNVLFLADRTQLVRQAKYAFSKVLPNYSTCNLVEDKNSAEESRIVFSTYPTMMNSIDSVSSKDGKVLFTPSHFDLVILDESHRSIYNKYEAIINYFDALLVGLTATPKDEMEANTYRSFDLENGNPTFAYELEEAVRDGYLVSYFTREVTEKCPTDGIHYDDLTDDQKEQYEQAFWIDNADMQIGNEVSGEAFNNWVFNKQTMDIMITDLMTKGRKVEGGDKIGKTIIFARNHNHAIALQEEFDKLYPQYKGKLAVVIDNQVKYAETLIDDFSKKDSYPQIAISVDMLDTGIDVPEVVNLVFAKQVRSKTKFWQMIGRGTRLCPDLYGIGQDKKDFLIFDYGRNFEFFRQNPKGEDGALPKGLTERIFCYQCELIKELQDMRYQDEPYTSYRSKHLEDAYAQTLNLDDNNFIVRQYLEYIVKYKIKDNWNHIGENDLSELKYKIAPLVTAKTDDEKAKRFDLLMYQITLCYLLSKDASVPIRRVISVGKALAEVRNIKEVNEKKDVIKSISEPSFWEDLNIQKIETVRKEIRDLLQYIEGKHYKAVTIDVDDEIIDVIENSGIDMPTVNNLKNYRERIQFYLEEHKQDETITKVSKYEDLDANDVQYIRDLFIKINGTEDDYAHDYANEKMTRVIQRIVGVDRTSVERIFDSSMNMNSLNAKQYEFVVKVIESICVNGYIEPRSIINDFPFKAYGDPSKLFGMGSYRSFINAMNKVNNYCE